MKAGVSTYSLVDRIAARQMSVLEVMQWIAGQGGEHVELVPAGFELDGNMALVDDIRAQSARLGLDISNYAITANFVVGDQAQYEQELKRVMRHVDIAGQLGTKLMRHDVAFRPPGELGDGYFETDLERMVGACREIADYAGKYGITTSVENHGHYLQASARVARLVELVDRANFRTTLDMANFLCVDEDPVEACKRNIPYASMIHAKDFYTRPAPDNPGEGWAPSANGNYLRGAIFGHGDVQVREILRLIKASGYDGYLSLEFEGLEDSLIGTRIGLANLQRIWSEV